MPPKNKEEIANGGGQWNVWSAIEILEAAQEVFYPELTPRIVAILRDWAEKWCGHLEWRSMLNKHSLHKEVEESIVAIHYLLEATTGYDENSIIVMDICAGKGLFSFLLSYLKPPHIKEIILLEKAAINWYHIREGANPTALEEGRPYITIWENTNLHDYDDVLDRIMALPLPVAMTGIHLCKQLGPSFCGLVNGLGTSKCVYACLAPCCLPRAVTAQKGQKPSSKPWLLAIQLKETEKDRQNRKDYMERRGRLKRKPKGGPCFYCHDQQHGLIDCPILPTLSLLEQERIRRSFHKATIPCWNCLAYGHYKQACPEAVERNSPLAMSAPQMELNVSQVLSSEKPYHTYCSLLAEGFQERKRQVIETNLESSVQHQDGNWNSERKSIFIVAK